MIDAVQKPLSSNPLDALNLLASPSSQTSSTKAGGAHGGSFESILTHLTSAKGPKADKPREAVHSEASSTRSTGTKSPHKASDHGRSKVAKNAERHDDKKADKKSAVAKTEKKDAATKSDTAKDSGNPTPTIDPDAAALLADAAAETNAAENAEADPATEPAATADADPTAESSAPASDETVKKAIPDPTRVVVAKPEAQAPSIPALATPAIATPDLEADATTDETPNEELPRAVEEATTERHDETSTESAEEATANGPADDEATTSDSAPTTSTTDDTPKVAAPNARPEHKSKSDALDDAIATAAPKAEDLIAAAKAALGSTKSVHELRDGKGLTPKERDAKIAEAAKVDPSEADALPAKDADAAAAAHASGDGAKATATASERQGSATKLQQALDASKVRIESVSSPSRTEVPSTNPLAANGANPASLTNSALGTSRMGAAGSLAHTVPIQAILNQIQRSIKPGTSELRLRLDPASLGALTLKFTMRGDSLAVVVRASRPEVVEALKSDLKQFTDTLSKSGIDVSQFDIALDPDQRRDSETFRSFQESFEGEGGMGAPAKGSRTDSRPKIQTEKSLATNARLDVMA